MTEILKAKVAEMLTGKSLIMSDQELDDLIPYRISNFIRTVANPNQVGTLDRWEAWVLNWNIENRAAEIGISSMEFGMQRV